MKSLKTLIGDLTSRLVVAETDSRLPEQIPLVDAVAYAREEWNAARAYFETVSDPELVDHAIYLLEAAEKKYMYLLKQARMAGIRAEEGSLV